MAQQGQLATFTITDKANDYTDLGSVIKKYIYHWPLFVLSLIFFITAAIIYLSITPPVYEVKTSLMIKDNKQNQEQQPSALQEINLSNSSKIIENEIEILKSKKLMTAVVRDLNLWINYQQKDGFKTEDLYKDSPVKFTLTEPISIIQDRVFDLVIIDTNHFNLLTPEGGYKGYIFNKTYKSKLGNWKIELTDKYTDYKGKELRIAISSAEKIATAYQQAFDIGLINKLSSAVILTIDDQVPERGKDVLNTLVKNYNLLSINEKNEDIKNTLNFLDQKIDELSGELEEAEKGIAGFKRNRGLADISTQSQISLQNLQANDNKLNEANLQLNIINNIDQYVNSSQNSEKISSVNGISDVALNSLIGKLSQLQLQYEQLAATTPETSPEFDPINRQIKTTKAAIKESVKNIKTSLQGTRDKLQSYNSNFESSIRNIPTQERQYISIKRQQSSKETLYTYYLQKREEVAASYAATLKDDKVIDQAYYEKPKSPKKSFTYALSALLGFIIPTGLLYVRNSLNTKILSVKELKDVLKNPVVAELPFEYNNSPIAISQDHISATSEQFRALRTRFRYLHNNKETGRVTLVTSSVPGEGKSFISTNISLALASVGRKTVIVELDMRKPKIAINFNLPKNMGLSDYLMGNACLTDILQGSKNIPNLHVISSGSEISNPSELLEEPALKTLIEKLKETFDDIIIDSPPSHLVPDAMIVSPTTDICLYIVRQGFTDKSELEFINNLATQNQILNAHIIFNGIEKAKYGYGYNYNNTYYTKKNRNTFKVSFKIFLSRF